ncbi:MAG TPA: adenylyl-sulfate kinase, partial [Anaeromyxobacteraceae bacterium]|nr:adenylyl-sulfate kinase [Anaeromyxobacteraceae bacterium]
MPQGGTVIWITGLPASGKSTLAARLRERLEALGRPAVVLDGDAVREALVPRPGYSAEERDAFYRTLAGLAALLALQ